MPYSSDNDYYDHHHSRRSSPLPAPVGLPPSARVNPAYSVEEVFMRNGKQDSHHLRAHAYREGIERHRGRSLSSSAPRRIDEGRRRYHDSDSDSDSDSDDLSPHSSPRPRRTMIPYDSHRGLDRYSSPPPRHRSPSRHHSPSPTPTPHRSTPLLPLALATITTAAACNNIYQSHKASRARRAHIRRGEMSEAQAKTLENQAAVMDLISVGVAAVGVHNAVGGWRKVRVGG